MTDARGALHGGSSGVRFPGKARKYRYADKPRGEAMDQNRRARNMRHETMCTMSDYDKDTLDYLRGCGCGEALVERVARIMLERDEARKGGEAPS